MLNNKNKIVEVNMQPPLNSSAKPITRLFVFKIYEKHIENTQGALSC